MQVISRPGKVTQLDIPIIMMGEISGTVFYRGKGGNHEAQGVKVELLDETGHMVQSVISDYDGFYLFTKLKAGKYSLDPVTDNVNNTSIRKVEILADGTIADGIDLVIDGQTIEPVDTL